VYVGTNYDVDMAAIGEDPETRRWWKLTDAMQESFTPGATGSGGSVPWWTVGRNFSDHDLNGSLYTHDVILQDLEEVFWFEGKK
jgi:hypothetical protein